MESPQRQLSSACHQNGLRPVVALSERAQLNTSISCSVHFDKEYLRYPRAFRHAAFFILKARKFAFFLCISTHGSLHVLSSYRRFYGYLRFLPLFSATAACCVPVDIKYLSPLTHKAVVNHYRAKRLLGLDLMGTHTAPATSKGEAHCQSNARTLDDKRLCRKSVRSIFTWNSVTPCCIVNIARSSRFRT